jgi:hypothetical protein
MGVARGRELTCAELVRELTVLRQNKDSLRLAEFNVRLKDLLYPKTEPDLPRYLTQDPDAAVGAFMTTIGFFIDVAPDEVWDITRLTYHPEDYQYVEGYPGDAEVQEAKPASPSAVPAASPITRPASFALPNAAPSPVLPPVPATPPPLPPRTPARPAVSSPRETSVSTPRRPSNAEIRSMVEAVFPPTGNAEEQLPQILEMLGTLADRYGDEAIRDLYFFNVQHGKFEWLG